MMPKGYTARILQQGYGWLASFFSLWLAIAYLWMALFYPLMCAPYHSGEYKALDGISTFEHTTTPLTAVMNVSVGWVLYLTPDDSSNTSWLLESHDDTTGLALTFINVLSVPMLAWLNSAQPTHMVALLHTELYKQFRVPPPERPPRLFPL